MPRYLPTVWRSQTITSGIVDAAVQTTPSVTGCERFPQHWANGAVSPVDYLASDDKEVVEDAPTFIGTKF